MGDGVVADPSRRVWGPCRPLGVGALPLATCLTCGAYRCFRPSGHVSAPFVIGEVGAGGCADVVGDPGEVRLPSREHDGFAAIDLSDRDWQAALKELGVDTADATLASHAKLDMRRGYVA